MATTKKVQLLDKDDNILYPVIHSDYCIEDSSIEEEKLSNDIQEKLNNIVIKIVTDDSSEEIKYKLSDDNFIDKVANYYALYNSGKPISFFFEEITDIKYYYQIPVKSFYYYTSSNSYCLKGRDGNYNIECIVYMSQKNITVSFEKDSLTVNDIPNNSITKFKLADQAVITDKLADGAITKEKLADDVLNSLSTNNLHIIPLQFTNVDVIEIDSSIDLSTLIDFWNDAINNNTPVYYKITFSNDDYSTDSNPSSGVAYFGLFKVSVDYSSTFDSTACSFSIDSINIYNKFDNKTYNYYIDLQFNTNMNPKVIIEKNSNWSLIS